MQLNKLTKPDNTSYDQFIYYSVTNDQLQYLVPTDNT